jgi:hypothetical protein
LYFVPNNKARIMAAQERARIAEQREKEARAAAAHAEAERRKSQNAAAIAETKLRELQKLVQAVEQQQKQADQRQAEKRQAEQEQIQRQEQQLRQSQAQQKRDKILRELEGLPAESPVPTEAIPIMKSMDTPPPPPFDPMGLVAPRPQQQHEQQFEEKKQVPHQMSPPPFDAMEKQHMTNTPIASIPLPSAPPIHDHLEGVVPMPAPLPPPPSFAEFEQQMQQKQSAATHQQLETDTSFDFDVDGIPLSPEERQQMLEEQRRLYENIMKEKAANDEAIARATADAFDSRSTAATAKAEVRNEQMDAMGRDLDHRATATGGPKTEGEEDEVNAPRRFVKIGNNQTVALHGQERTKKAIKEGTALLVQCINCQNWMQVSLFETAAF